MAQESYAREAREPHTPYGRVRREKKKLSPVSLSVFSLIPDLLFDCSRVLEYAKIRTVLQSSFESESFCNSEMTYCWERAEGWGVAHKEHLGKTSKHAPG